MDSPDFTTKAGRDALNDGVDRMISVHALCDNLTPDDMEFQVQALDLFTGDEIAHLFVIAINRLAGHDTTESPDSEPHVHKKIEAHLPLEEGDPNA